jgi:tetratricopeptide (TPR) repeat protein
VESERRRVSRLRNKAVVVGPRLGGTDPFLRLTALVKLGRHEDAVAGAEAFLLTDPDHLSALELLAKSLWQVGEMERVVDVTRKLIRLNPYEPGYQTLLASALQCLGRYGEAACAYQRAGSAPGVQEAVTELNSWQAGLVADLIASDPVFRAHYAQNPADACAARGFSFLEGDASGDRWLVGAERRASLFTRPS